VERQARPGRRLARLQPRRRDQGHRHDALGLHLDLFQRIAVDPASITAIRYTPLRSFVLRSNDSGGDLAGYAPPKRRRRVSRKPSSDAAVGGGVGGGAGVEP